jgi:hypothetical protein
MERNQGKARVTRTTDKRSPRGIRRLGQALIALAQAQAEAEAQAQAEANTKTKPKQQGARIDAPPQDDASRPPGDAV